MVSSACATGATAISSRTRGRNRASSSRAASPAAHPSDTENPHRALSTDRARRTGRKCPQANHAARAFTRGPYWTRPRGIPSAAASVIVPQPPHVLATTRCSVTCGRGGTGGTSNTWRRCTPKTSAPSRASPQPRHACGSCTNVSSGSSIRRRVALGAPCRLPLPDRPREERLGAGRFTNGESEDGGLPLLDESRPNRACTTASKPSNSATQLDNTTFSAARAALRAARAAISASPAASDEEASSTAAP